MRWSAGALVGACALLWADALAGGALAGATPVLLVVAVLSLLTGLAARPTAAGLAGLVATAFLVVADQLQTGERFSIANDGVFYAVVVFAPAMVGGLVAARNRQVGGLIRLRRELEVRRDIVVRGAQAREHEHVARRVEAVLATRLRGIVAGAQELADAADAGRLEAIESTARTALSELREILGVLRTPSPHDSRGLVDERREHDLAVVPGAAAELTGARLPSRAVDALMLLALVPLAIETSVPAHVGWWGFNVIAALAQGFALVVIPRHPLPGVLLLVALATAQTALLTPLPATVSWLLPGLLAPFLLAFWQERRTAALGLAVMIAGVALVTLATPPASRSLAGLVPGLIMGVLAWAGGRAVAARDHRARELRAIAGELRRTAHEQAELAAAEQRARLARELHDVGAHALTVVCLQAGAARAWWHRDREQAQPALDSVLALARGPIAQLSTSLFGLAQHDGADPLDPGSLEALAGLSRALGLRVEVSVSGATPAVRHEIAQVAYRIVQEALTNAARHAGRTFVRIELARAGDVLDVRVVDTGPDPASPLILPVSGRIGAGLGLRGMRERVDAVAGELIAGPYGPGFQVRARLPA